MPDAPGRGYAQLTATQVGAEVEVGERLRSNLTAAVYVGKPWAGPVEAGAKLKLTW